MAMLAVAAMLAAPLNWHYTSLRPVPHLPSAAGVVAHGNVFGENSAAVASPGACRQNGFAWLGRLSSSRWLDAFAVRRRSFQGLRSYTRTRLDTWPSNQTSPTHLRIHCR